MKALNGKLGIKTFIIKFLNRLFQTRSFLIIHNYSRIINDLLLVLPIIIKFWHLWLEFF